MCSFIFFSCETADERAERRSTVLFINVIKRNYEQGDYENIVKSIDDFQKKYPNSINNKEILKIKENSINEIERIKKEEREKIYLWLLVDDFNEFNEKTGST